MNRFILGTVIALTVGMLSYAALVASSGRTPVAAAAAAQPQRSAADIAARDRMAQLVAEVAARSAAQTAKSVVMNHLQARPAPEMAEEKTASR